MSLREPPLLEASHVSKSFAVGRRWQPGGRKTLRAVNDVSFSVRRGETLGLVGESGCGKSTLGRCLLRLHDVSAGEIFFEGTNITRLGQGALRPLRRRMQMVFQDPYSSLNPRRRVGDLLAEPLRVHGLAGGGKLQARLQALMEVVGLRREHLTGFPHEFSGGQRQRIGIARALALQPALIVADEPVSALDVSVQAQIVNLLADLQEQLGLTYIFIAHDLAVVRQIASRTAVMYLGAIVELGETEAVFGTPAHPYTAALLSAVPVADISGPRRERVILGGEVPSPVDPPRGCGFHPRCPRAQPRCREEAPVLDVKRDGQQAACHFPLAPGETLADRPAG